MKSGLKITFSKSAPKIKKVTVPQYLRDDGWAISIGVVQRKLDSLMPLKDEVTFDFRETRWIDPLPLLSILIEIVRLNKRGIAVQAYFPSGDSIVLSSTDERNIPYQKSPNRLLLFLAREGFFHELIVQGIVAHIGSDKLDSSIIASCSSLKAIPSYADAQFIPVRLFDVPQLGDGSDSSSRSDFSANTVEKILKGTDVSLHSRCSTLERRHLLHTLRAVLQELLHNVQEHAYNTTGFSPAAVYVRYRQGGTKQAGGTGRDFYEACTKLEIDNCPRVNRDWLDTRSGCLEVFFLDRGVGIVKKLNGDKNTASFSSVMERTFLDGQSSKKTRRTEHGGLHLLHNRMRRSNDYIRALNDQTWFGSSVPFTRKSSTVASPIIQLAPGEGIVGQAYHLRLSWRASTDERDTWLHFNELEVTQVWKELCKPASACKELFAWYDQCLVIDERFRNNEEFTVTHPLPFVLWLPKRGLMKWDILDNLERIAGRVTGECTLVIADIPSMEAAMYKAAMSMSDFDLREVWPKQFRRVVLATNRWTFAYAEHVNREGGAHGFTPFHTDNIPNTIKTGIGTTETILSFRQIVLHWLKWHDSRRLWQEVTKGDRLFLPEKVVWSEKIDHTPDKIINGYLDFPGTTHNNFCAELYRNALSRIFGILDERDCILVPVDRLADPVVHDVYAHEVYDPPRHDKAGIKVVATGSVLVSGSTLHATVQTDTSIHFFIHGDSEHLGTYPSLFHWMPNVLFENLAPTQKRIGKTSAIAPQGWLSIEIPRFDVDGKSVGFRRPEECYEDWQNSGPIIAKLGHWHYEGHHDFLTINIPDAVEDAFSRNGPLAQFLLMNILHPLGINQNQIAIACKEYPSYPTSNPGILVYRSHPSSERIIDMVLSTLDTTARLEVMQWIFPVLPLRMRWGGSTLLVPPRMREEMSATLKKRKNAIIFDDAAITGRTIQDLLTSLRALGASNIQVVTIANRLRLPAETGTVKHFWRLDVPTMGRQGTCPLCQALEAARSLAREMVSCSEAQFDIQHWISTWSHASPLNEWDAGLDPLPLQDLQPPKKYCYRQSTGEYLCSIPLNRSTGLTIHAAEVHAMTASDDYGLKKVREQNDPAIQIELAASQLLLFGDELDQDLVRDIAIEGLLEPLTKLQSDSSYGHLAVLTLMRTLTATESKQVPTVITNKARVHIEKLKSLRHGQILLAFLISQELIDWTDDTCYAGTRLLSTRHRDVATKLRSLFREIVTPSGNIHSEPIPALLIALQNGDSKPKTDLLSSVLNSLAKLKDVVKELGLDWASSDDDGSYIDKRSNLEISLTKTETAIRDKAEPDALTKCLQKVQDDLYAVADCYFYRISPNETPKGGKFKETLASIWEKKINWDYVAKCKGLLDDVVTPENQTQLFSSPAICHSSDSGLGSNFGSAKWIWLLWHEPLQKIIKDLLMNAAYPKMQGSLISDPWADEDTEQAHMWVHIKYGPRSACLTFANYSQKPCITFEEIRNGAQGKTRWETLTELGGKVYLDTEMTKRSILAIQVHLPYAPFLQHRDDTTGGNNAAI